jgi:acetyl esterase/lipase
VSRPRDAAEAAAAKTWFASSAATRSALAAPAAALDLGRRALSGGPGTEHLLDTALREALGDDYLQRVPERAALGGSTGRLSVVRARARLLHLADQQYGDGDPATTLDVWRHSDLPREVRAPVLLQVPGGAWVMGSKTGQAYPLLSHLADQGWVVVSIGYRHAPGHPWPAQVVDVKRALVWVRRHAAELGADPSRVAVTGGSAGGHLAALAALTPNDPAFQPGFEAEDTSVAAAAPMYGRYDWQARTGRGRGELMQFLERVVVQQPQAKAPDVFRAASPLARVGPDAPPFFVVHGTQDSIIPVEQGRAFAAALKAVSQQPVAFAELPGARHSFDLVATARSVAVARAVGRFLETAVSAR